MKSCINLCCHFQDAAESESVQEDGAKPTDTAKQKTMPGKSESRKSIKESRKSIKRNGTNGTV